MLKVNSWKGIKILCVMKMKAGTRDEHSPKIMIVHIHILNVVHIQASLA